MQKQPSQPFKHGFSNIREIAAYKRFVLPPILVLQ